MLISNVQRQFFRTPGRKAHYNLTCSYTLTDDQGKVYKVSRSIFKNTKEGDIGRKASKTIRDVTPQFVKKLTEWEKAKFTTNIISKTPVRQQTPKPIPVNPMLPMIQVMQAQIADLKKETKRLSDALAIEKTNNKVIVSKQIENKAQLARVTQALEILLRR